MNTSQYLSLYPNTETPEYKAWVPATRFVTIHKKSGIGSRIFVHKTVAHSGCLGADGLSRVNKNVPLHFHYPFYLFILLSWVKFPNPSRPVKVLEGDISKVLF